MHPPIIAAFIQTDPFTIGSAFTLFFAFLIGHAMADFPLQGDFVSRFKNRHWPKPEDPKLDIPDSVWLYCLTSHSLIHGGFVWAITANPALGAIEVVTHWLIDFMKGEGVTNFHSDQILHILCKLAYVGLIWSGVFSMGW